MPPPSNEFARPRRWPPTSALLLLLAALLLFGGPPALWLWGVSWNQVLLGGLAALLLLGCLAWWWGIPLVGPLFYYELVRLARRGRTTFVRTTYALALLAVLWLAYDNLLGRGHDLRSPFAAEPTLSPNDMARIGRQFVMALLTLQAATVYVLTPAYVAGAIAEEREKRTLEMLFTTHLRNREIVLGKMLARVMHIGGILLAGLPVLCLVLFWGGVDPRMIFIGFAATALPLLSVGSISIWCSALQRTRTAALVTSYVFLFGLGLCCLPFPGGHLSSSPVFLLQLEERLSEGVTMPWFLGGPGVARSAAGTPATADEIMAQMVCEYAAVHGGITLLLLAWTVAALRWGGDTAPIRLEELDIVLPPPMLATPPPPPTPYGMAALEPVGRYAPVPLIRSDPLLWKEADYSPQTSASYPFLLFCAAMTWCLVILLFIVALGFLVEGRAYPHPSDYRPYVRAIVNPALRLLTIVLGLLACLTASLRAAGSISRERERQTLDSLLTLPVEWRDILWAKWLGPIWGLRPLGYALAVVWVVGVLTGALHPLAVLLLAGEIGSMLALLVSVALFLSVLCPSTLRAHVLVAAVLFGVIVGPWLASFLGPALFPRDLPGWSGLNWGSFGSDGMLNPLGRWWWAGFEEFSGSPSPQAHFAGAVIGVALLGIAAWIFWRYACWGFGAGRPRYK